MNHSLPSVIHTGEKMSAFSEHWSPRVIAELNDYQIKLAKLKGEFVWHEHEHTDEMFYVLDGSMVIDFPDGSVSLESGDLLVVPKGVQHRPKANEECTVMLIEPGGVINTGEAGGELTAEPDVWI